VFVEHQPQASIPEIEPKGQPAAEVVSELEVAVEPAAPVEAASIAPAAPVKPSLVWHAPVSAPPAAPAAQQVEFDVQPTCPSRPKKLIFPTIGN